MKVSNWRRKLFAALVAGGIWAPGMALAAPLDTNLIVNPGFEDVDTNTTCCFDAVQINSWRDGTQPGFAYNYAQNYDNGGPLTGGGTYYFTSNGDNGGADIGVPGQVAQNIDLSGSDTGALIPTGEAAFFLSGFFSSYLGDGDFGTLHVDFLNSGGTSLGTGQVSDNDVSTWTLESTAGLVPVGTATARVSVFGTALAGGQDGYIDNVDLQVNEVSGVLLILEVNTGTGNATLSNSTGDPISIDYYEILSDGGALDAAGWDSLQEQELPGFPAGDGTGDGWEQAGNVGPKVLSESYLTGNSPVGDQASIDLGDLFNSGGSQDLEIRYGLASGQLVEGFVRYVFGFNPADFDEDGDVDGNDFLLWQAGFPTGSGAVKMDGDFDNDGDVDGNDFLGWQSNFGGSSGNGSAAVPEPASVLLVGVGLVGAIAIRRRRQ